MTKILSAIILTALFSVFMAMPLYAATVRIDDSNKANGIVIVTLSDYAGTQIKAQVQKGDSKYLYTLIRDKSNLLLQLGAGEYTVTVFEVIGGKGKALASLKVNATAIDEKAMFKSSNPYVDYDVSTKAIPDYKKLTENNKAEKDRINAVYENIVTSFEYDRDLAKKIIDKQITEYVPVIDTVYDMKKGICFGYSAVFGGALRSQGIPTRMVWGYTADVDNGKTHHAWNEILIDGKWVSVDTTLDTSLANAKKPYSLSRDRSKAIITKIY